MKKVIGVSVLSIFLSMNYFNETKAQEEFQCDNINGRQVCFTKEIMGELAKEAIYYAGTKVLEKVKNNEFKTTSSSSTNTTTTTSNSYSNYVDNSSNNTQEVQEEMIPI